MALRRLPNLSTLSRGCDDGLSSVFILRNSSSVLQAAVGSTHRSSPTPFYCQSRSIVHAHYAPIAPRPPPRIYEPDGTLRRYKTNACFWDHGIHWVRWQTRRGGVFHIFFHGETSEEVGPRAAYREQFRWWAQYIPAFTFGMVASPLVWGYNVAGISPQLYTEDWIEASRERDRAENSYPFTRYLDRRRKERGSHWLVSNFHPNNCNWVWQQGQRDTAYLRAKAIKARKLWLEQEDRRSRIEEEDRKLESLNEREQAEIMKAENELQTEEPSKDKED